MGKHRAKQESGTIPPQELGTVPPRGAGLWGGTVSNYPVGLFLTLDLLLAAVGMNFLKMWYCSWTSRGQKSGTKTNSPAYIYIYISFFVVGGSPPLSVYIYIYISLSLYIYIYLSLSLTPSVCLSCSLNPPLQLSWPVLSLYVFSLSLSRFLSLSLSLSLSISVSFCSYHTKSARNLNVHNTGEMLIKSIMVIPRCPKMRLKQRKC